MKQASARHEAGPEPMSPFRPSRLFGLARSRLVVVVDGDRLETIGPAFAAQGDDAVARMRRTLFGNMCRRGGIVIGGAADAARIEDDGTVGDADQFRAVAV